MVTLEQVEKLCERANISYDEARKVLEETNGDLLDAMILLEKQNRIQAPKGGGYYNSKTQQEYKSNYDENQKSKGSSFGELLGRFIKWCGKIISKGNRNFLEVTKNAEKVITIPVTVLALLLLFMFWITIPLIIVGLFFNYRYEFSGPDLGKESVNRAMDSAAEMAENLKKEVKGEKSDGENSNH